MKRIILGSLAAGLLAVILSGCGPKVVTVPHSQAPHIIPDENHAVVYVMREWSFTQGGRNFPVYEDGKEIGVLATDTYFIHKTNQGKKFYHVERVGMGSFVEIENNKTYYLLIDATQMDGMSLKEIPPSLAKQIIPKLKYALP